MTKRRPRPDQAASAALGGFYQQIPEPDHFVCSRCGEERNRIDAEDLCLQCRWKIRGTPGVQKARG